MGKTRTLKFLIDKGFLNVGDSFKIAGFESLIEEINDNFKKVKTNRGWLDFSDKVYPPLKKVDQTVVVSSEPTISKNTTEFKISFSCKTDYEYVDKESKTMEESLEKARTMTPWQLILKSEPVDVQDSEVNIFGLISNEL